MTCLKLSRSSSRSAPVWTVASAAVEVPVELALEAATVGEAGQDVVVGEVGEAVEVAPPVGDVDDVDQHDLAHLRVTDDGAAQGHADVVAAGVPEVALGLQGLAAVEHQPPEVVLDPGLARGLEVGEPVAHHVGRVQAHQDGHRDVDRMMEPEGSSRATPCGASSKSCSTRSLETRARRLCRSRSRTIRCRTGAMMTRDGAPASGLGASRRGCSRAVRSAAPGGRGSRRPGRWRSRAVAGCP